METTTQEPSMTTSSYTVFTRSTSDHSLVHIIADEISNYFSAHELARRCAGSVMYSDQFNSHFTATSPNRMNGTLA
jgi:hypothetical protein